MIYKIEDLANELWSRDIPINSARGLIYDRNGKVIVSNELAISVASINKQVKEKENAAKSLARILECDEKLIYNHLLKNNSIEIIKPEGRKISYTKAMEINKLKIDGIYIVSDSIRHYPYKSTLAQALGFCGIDNDGLSGIEYIYNDYLKPVKGELKIYTDAKGNLMNDATSIYNNSGKGMDLYLSFDIEIAQIIDNQIKNIVNEYNPDRVMALMVDVVDGGILAMSSYPFYDPSNYQSYDEEIYSRNLPIFYAYEPGSTFKIATYAMGIEENAFDLNEQFYCAGYKNVEDRKIRCWKSGGHKSETALECIENSCNPFFMTIGERIGVEKFYDYLHKFGFGEKTNIDLLGEASGLILNSKYAGPVELACMSFGQTNSATELQLCMAAIAATNGELLKPFVLKNIVNDAGEILYEAKRTVRRRVVSDKTASIMRYALERVVACGTGRGGYVEGMRVMGKTGTSQTVIDGHYSNQYILSFLGMAPADNPRVAMILAIDNPKNTVQYGGVVAAPIVGKILEQVLPYLKIDKDYDNQINRIDRYFIDTKKYTVSNYVGIGKKDIKIPQGYKLAFYGNGERVIYQSPEAGEKINEGDSVMLYLG